MGGLRHLLIPIFGGGHMDLPMDNACLHCGSV